TPRRARGRPRGMTEQGAAARRQLYEAAIALITARGYEATTLRDIAKHAGVSTGLLYRYVPNKRAVILALYDELSAEYAARAAAMPPGTWGTRFVFALTTSLGVLAPQRDTLAALTPVLIGTADEGLFAPGTAFSRRRVQAVFFEAVRGASDAPGPGDAAALARLLYVVHLAVILWWLFDKTPRQRATRDLLALLEGALPMAALALRLEPARNFVRTADILCREGLFGDDDDPAPAGAHTEEA
ncbi:MAG TPA: TetR/AcrR family transcriptional regulator, partial [Kofleriaceae bacterium]